MRKRAFFTVLGGVNVVTVVAVALLFRGGKSLLKTTANKGESNTLSLSGQKISTRTSSYNEEISSNVLTTNNNPIEIKCSNVINNDSGWQTILPNGYFYNPLNNSTDANKISGISSIRFDSAGSNTLSLSYGYTLDDSNVIYSYEKTLSPNVDYNLGTLAPTYIYIKNNNNSNVDISNFSITYSCVEEAYPMQDLNILMIGNSFADDTVFYTERVAAAYGINLHIYDAYIASCTIDMHYSNLNNDSATYSMRNVINSSWNYQNDMTLKNIINSHTWDIITFQQASAAIGRSNTYSNLANLVSAVRSLVGSTPKFYWYQTWAYDSDYHDYYDYFSYFNNNQITMYNAINSCYASQVEPLGVFDKLVPAGTAVQNLRTSYMKETFTRDGKHMSSVHGRYLLGLNFLSHVYDIDLEKSPCSYLPPEVDSSFKRVAYESVKNSWKNPLNSTNSLYPTRELTNYNLSQYTEIDAELLGCSFWNSTDSNYYNVRQSNVSGTSNIYTTTKRFSQSELPIGSLVVIDDAFGVRPEAWASDAVQGSRPGENYANIIEVNSAFWSGYQYRAFNIFKAGKTDLIGQYSQIFDGFHIYVPNSAMAGLTPKANNTAYNADKTLFTNNGLNIDAYERIHLDPITGFYKCDSYYELKNSYVDDTAKKFLCTRPFYSVNNDLPENTVIIVDGGYQWRSDCWGDHATYSPRPSNVSTQFSVLDSSFWNGFRRRTFNVSSTSSAYVGQNYISFMNHLRIYTPIQSIPGTPVTGVNLSKNSLSLYSSESFKLVAEVTPFYAENKLVTWTTNNSGVATVDSDGTAHAISAGNATITATTQDGGYTASCLVEVTQTITNYPEGTYTGTASVLGNSFPITLAIGNQHNRLVAVRLTNTDAVATGISVDPSTNVVSITTSGSYSGYTFGTITGTYDVANQSITGIKCNGSISSYVSNNGSITAIKAVSGTNKFFADCDGTTSELQSQFKRRYMSGSWQVDTSNADRFTSNTTEFVSGGGAMKRRGYASNAVALNLNTDFSPSKTCSNIHFWVYNPSANDITLRMWGYKGSNLSSNFETGSVTAKANGWSYLAMGFTSAAIYNFQIADFTNSGVYLTFDNIYLF